MARVEKLFHKRKKLPSGYVSLGRISKALYLGARQAERAARTNRERLDCGSFHALIGWIDDLNRLNLILYKGAKRSEELWFAALAPTTAEVTILMIGSGIAVAKDYWEALTRFVSQMAPKESAATTPLPTQAGYLGLALLDLLERGIVPFSGGGVQMMTLDLNGSKGWELRSSSVEYYNDQTANPDWQIYTPERLTE